MSKSYSIIRRIARISSTLGAIVLLAGIILSLVQTPARAAGPVVYPQQDPQPTETPTEVPVCTPPGNWDRTIRLFHERTSSKEWHFEVPEPEMNVTLTFFYYQDYEKSGCPKDCATVKCQSDETGEGETPLGSFSVSDGQKQPNSGKEKLRGRLPQGSYTASFHVTGKGSINIGMRVEKDSVPTNTPQPTVTIPVEPTATATPEVTFTATVVTPEQTPTQTVTQETPGETPETTVTIVPPQETPTATETPTDPPSRPKKTPTATPTLPPATLAPPSPPPGTSQPPALIPVTGGDRSPQADSEGLRQRLLVNLGIGLLGLGLICFGISRRMRVT